MLTRWNSSTNARPARHYRSYLRSPVPIQLYPLDYDSALNIRELKKVALEKVGMNISNAGTNPPVLVHVIRCRDWCRSGGSGSRLLPCQSGHPVTLFEREANAGGVVKNIILSSVFLQS